jgi:hypothetical protein
MKVTVVPEIGTKTPLLCFSSKDSNCISSREALARGTDGKPTSLFIKREQFNDPIKELFINVKCLDNCKYTLKFEGSDYAEIDVNSVYSYLATAYNREMRFKVKGEVEEGSFLTIGIEGSSTAQLYIQEEEKIPYDIYKGKIITFPIKSKDNGVLTYFTIKNAE